MTDGLPSSVDVLPLNRKCAGNSPEVASVDRKSEASHVEATANVE